MRSHAPTSSDHNDEVLAKPADIACQIRALAAESVTLVAIDGPAGAGKSTFATKIATSLGDVPVVTTDDFATWRDPFGWWPRFFVEVIEPLLAGRPATYRCSRWDNDTVGEQVVIAPAPIVILEGVSAARRDWAQHLAFIIWVETPWELRLDRGLARDGRDAASLWEDWMAAEDAHFAADRTWERANLIVRGDA
jgi:uridine kinase